MNQRVIIVIAVIAVVALAVVGGAAAWFLRPPATPSGALTAIPVQSIEAPTEVVDATEEATATTEAAALSVNGLVFELVQLESEARFLVEEILAGQDKTVVGVTDQVAAQIIIDPENPANVQLGPVIVNVRDLRTDSGNRNRAIQNAILITEVYEFVTFTPKEFIGLPETGAVGDTFAFQIVGDLSVKDLTKEVTMDVTVTVDSDTRLHGLGSVTISRTDFGLGVIQLPPQVASVEDEVILELEFVAEAAQ